MSTDTIQPRDQKETSILGYSAKIAGAMAVLSALITSLLASDEKTKWITDNLPLLFSGVTTLIGGGVVAGLALRRMKIDKAAKTLLLFLCMAFAMLLQGCVATLMEIPIKDSPKPVIVKRLAFCNAVEMPKISYIPSTGEISMEGYKSDGGAATMEAVAKGSAEGAVRGLKGTSGL